MSGKVSDCYILGFHRRRSCQVRDEKRSPNTSPNPFIVLILIAHGKGTIYLKIVAEGEFADQKYHPKQRIPSINIYTF